MKIMKKQNWVLTVTQSGLKSDFIPPRRERRVKGSNTTGVGRGMGGKGRVRVGPEKKHG